MPQLCVVKQDAGWCADGGAETWRYGDSEDERMDAEERVQWYSPVWWHDYSLVELWRSVHAPMCYATDNSSDGDSGLGSGGDNKKGKPGVSLSRRAYRKVYRGRRVKRRPPVVRCIGFIKSVVADILENVTDEIDEKYMNRLTAYCQSSPVQLKDSTICEMQGKPCHVRSGMVWAGQVKCGSSRTKRFRFASSDDELVGRILKASCVDGLDGLLDCVCREAADVAIKLVWVTDNASASPKKTGTVQTANITESAVQGLSSDEEGSEEIPACVGRRIAASGCCACGTLMLGSGYLKEKELALTLWQTENDCSSDEACEWAQFDVLKHSISGDTNVKDMSKDGQLDEHEKKAAVAAGPALLRMPKAGGISFSLALFNAGSNFEYYSHCAVRCVKALASKFSGCEFLIHADAEGGKFAQKRLFEAAKRNLRVFVYDMPISKRSKKVKKGAWWVVNGMRYRSLWEEGGVNGTVVTLDIHDSPKVTCEQLENLLQSMCAVGAEVGHTFWRANGAKKECPHGGGPPVRIKVKGGGHAHSDGGLCVWRGGASRARVAASGDFVQSARELIASVEEIPRGVDEMLMDNFLTDSGLWNLSTPFVFLPHAHVISGSELTTQGDMNGSVTESGRRSTLMMMSSYRKPVKKVSLHLDDAESISTSKARQEIQVLVCPEVNHSGNVSRRESAARARQYWQVSASLKDYSSFDALQEHHSACAVCGVGGEVVLCDTCSLVFHRTCHVPRLKRDECQPMKSTFNEVLWTCSFCKMESGCANEMIRKYALQMAAISESKCGRKDLRSAVEQLDKNEGLEGDRHLKLMSRSFPEESPGRMNIKSEPTDSSTTKAIDRDSLKRKRGIRDSPRKHKRPKKVE